LLFDIFYGSLLTSFDKVGNLAGKYSDNQLVKAEKNIFFYFFLWRAKILGVPRLAPPAVSRRPPHG
jgi:hypothetical protein